MALVTYVKGPDTAVADESLHDFMSARGWSVAVAEDSEPEPAATPPADSGTKNDPGTAPGDTGTATTTTPDAGANTTEENA